MADTPAASAPKVPAVSPGTAPAAAPSGAAAAPPSVPATTSIGAGASPPIPDPAPSGSTSPPSPAAPDGAPKPAQDTLPDLVRVAQAERRAARATKEAADRSKALDAVAAKETKFNDLVSKGDLLEAAKVYFPSDDVLADKLFWQLNDYVRKLPAPAPVAEPSVEERAAKAAREAVEAERKAQADRDAEAAKTKVAEADAKLAKERDAYFGQARKALAENPAAFPRVTAAILGGKIDQAEIVGHVEALGNAILARGLPEAELIAALRAETAPAAVFAALEQALAAESAPAAPVAPAPTAPVVAGALPTLADITAAAIAEAERREVARRPSTVSSSAVVGAAPVAPKDPREMTMAELDAWAIAEAEKRHQRTAAAG